MEETADESANEAWSALGRLLEAPPKLPYDAQELERLRRGLTPQAQGLVDDLEWTRGDR